MYYYVDALYVCVSIFDVLLAGTQGISSPYYGRLYYYSRIAYVPI